MSLETLLEAARYVEQLENKARAAAAAAAAATASVPDHSHAVAPHSNHHNSTEPRGAKLKRERAEQDDLFCEEKMLIIDEEEPLENHSRANGNHQQQLHHQTQPQPQQPQQQQQQQQQQQLHLSSHYGHQQHMGGGARGGGGISPSVGNSPPSSSGQQQQHHLVGLTAAQHEHEAPVATQHNHYFDSHNSNHSQGSAAGGTFIVDVETVTDSKKTRNGPCVIRSGTREVHNKLEKNRRAHLKECFELLKKQLPSQEEKKSSNLSILHAAIRHIQALRRKERDYEHEMERLAREKITAQQRIVSLKKELAATWDHIDFTTLLPEYNTTIEPTPKNAASESMEVDVPSGGLARGGTRYSSTSSLSSAATANSPQNLQTSSGGGGAAGLNANSNLHSQAATAAVVCQTQGLNLAQNSRESPPTSSSPGASNPSIPTPAQEKVTISPTIVQQTQQQAPAQLHLPISAQMLNTGQGLATIMPTLQHLGSGLRVIPSDGRQLIAVQSNGSVAGAANGDARPVALVVHSTTASNDNRVTFVHSTSGDRPLALAVQSSCSDVRPVAFVSGNEARPIVLATTHASAINVNNTQTRIRTADATQTTHKMVGGVTLVGGTGSELARLPGGAELNILPANGVFRSVKTQPLAVQGGLTLSHTSVSLQPSNKSGTTIQATTPQQQTVNNNSSNNNNHSSPVTSQQNHEGLAASCHLVASGQQPLAGLTPIVGPMTVMSQGNNQVILAPSSLAGKMIGTPLLKSVGQGHLPLTVNAAQYLNSLVKPVVVVSNSHQQAQQQSQQQQQQTTNNGVTVSSQSAV